MNATRRWIAEAIRFATDPQSGATIEQLTSEPVTSTNIYCEQRYTSSDGKRIALHRKPFGQPNEVWVADLRTMRLCRIAQSWVVAANYSIDAIYLIQQQADHAQLLRLDMQTLDCQVLYDFAPDDLIPQVGGAVTRDQRYFYHAPFAESDDHYSIRRLDLTTGQRENVCTIQDMFNPHLQLDPLDEKTLMVQVNRGGQRKRDGQIRKLSHSIGATLCAVDVATGQVTSLPVGRPHTPRITGHECWLARTGRLLFTAGQYQVTASSFVTLGSAPDEEKHLPPAAIYGLKPGDDQAQVVASGLMFNHLAASNDGQFFVADDHASGRIYIGSIATGRYLPLCDSHTRQGACQHSHVHAYMTPDNEHVVFNSIVTGCAQVYAARVPEGFLDAVLKAGDSS